MSSTQKNIEQVVDRILEDYGTNRDIDKLETAKGNCSGCEHCTEKNKKEK